MNKEDVTKVIVRIFVPPIGECAEGNTWENAAQRMEARLRKRLKIPIRLETIDLFSPEFFAHPEVAELLKSGTGEAPIITVNGRVIQTGGKLNERVIREALEEHAKSRDSGAGDTQHQWDEGKGHARE